MLPKEVAEEFKKIWREEFGEDISNEEATKHGINLLTLFNVIYRPIKKSWLEEYEKSKKGE